MAEKTIWQKPDHLGKRIGMSLFVVVICAISVGFFKVAAFGVDPFQALMAGLDKIIPDVNILLFGKEINLTSFGTLYVIVNAILFIFMLVFDRHYIGIATFINLFLLGYITEFTLAKLTAFLMANPNTVILSTEGAAVGIVLWARIICIVIGIVVICIGSAFYMTADLGVSTYDAVALIISNTWKKGKFFYVRIITDVICVIIGVGLLILALYINDGLSFSNREHALTIGKEIFAIAGIGTIITAFFMGPLIEVFNTIWAKPFLYGKEK